MKNNILLRTKDEAVLDPKCVSELFIDYFSRVANGIGFDDDVESAKDTIMKHSTHPSISEIKQNRHNGTIFEFKKVSEVDVKCNLCQCQFGAIFRNVSFI